jgi:hypothetical protein
MFKIRIMTAIVEDVHKNVLQRARWVLSRPNNNNKRQLGNLIVTLCIQAEVSRLPGT